MLAGLKSFAVNDYVVETFVIDATSQPPLIGAVLKSGDIDKVTAKGFVVTTDKTKYALENASDINAGYTAECANYDCTAFEGREFTCRMVHLKSNTKYYVYSYVVTDEGVQYGDVVEITSGNFNRCSERSDYANVYYAFEYTLFDGVTDEIIDPSTDGFYYSTNENADYMGYQKGTGYNTCYKFKTEWSYKLWKYNQYYVWKYNTKIVPRQPVITLYAKKLTMTTDEGATIYYCINGDGMRPENFTLKYTEPIDVEYGDVVYAYSISEQGYPSYTTAYKVLECLDEAIINLIDKKPYTREENTDKYSKINYVRIFNNTSWQALYIPFSMSYDDWKNDFDVAYINGIRQLDMDDDGAIDETIMDVIKIKNGSLIPNTPYLIRAKTTGEKTLSVSGATLYKAEENSIDCRTTIAEYTFTGTYNTIPASILIANNYYAMGGGSLVITDGTSDLKPYRWYMKIDARSPMYNVSNGAKAITINVVGEEETTGVNELRMTNDELPVYDLNGRRVNENNLKPGIYVKNGKKVIIK